MQLSSQACHYTSCCIFLEVLHSCEGCHAAVAEAVKAVGPTSRVYQVMQEPLIFCCTECAAYDRVGQAAVHAELALLMPLELRVSIPSGWCWVPHMHEGYAKALDQRVSASKQLLLVQAVWTLIHAGLRL